MRTPLCDLLGIEQPIVGFSPSEHVAGYKVPRSVWVVDTIERSPSGKPDYGWARRYAEDRPATADLSATGG